MAHKNKKNDKNNKNAKMKGQTEQTVGDPTGSEEIQARSMADPPKGKSRETFESSSKKGKSGSKAA